MLKIVENLSAVGALSRTPLGELIVLHRRHSWWGGGKGVAASQESYPRSRPSASVYGSPMKNPGTPFVGCHAPKLSLLVYSTRYLEASIPFPHKKATTPSAVKNQRTVIEVFIVTYGRL